MSQGRAVRLHRDREGQADAEDQHDAEDAPVGVVLAGGRHALAEHEEEAVHGGGHEGHGAAGRRVEAEDLTLAASGNDARQEGTRRGLGGANEDAQGQAKSPEDDGAAGVQEEDTKAGDDHRAQGQHDDLLRADLVVDPAEGDGREAGDDVRGDREYHDLSGGETEGGLGQDGTEGEDAGEAVAEDSGGNEEEEGVGGLVLEGAHGAPQELVGVDDRLAVAAGMDLLRHRGVHDHGDREAAEPQGGDHHGDTDIQVRVGGHAQQVHADEADVEDEQQDDAADVAGRPAEAGDLAAVFLLAQVVEHRVVVHRGELEEHVAQAEQRNTQHECSLGPKDRLGVHEVHGEHTDDDRAREPSEPDSAPASSIGTLAGDGGEQGDEQTRDRHAVTEPRRGRARVGEDAVAGQVGREHEGRGDRVEGGAAPVPGRPIDDFARDDAMWGGGRCAHGIGLLRWGVLGGACASRVKLPRFVAHVLFGPNPGRGRGTTSAT